MLKPQPWRSGGRGQAPSRTHSGGGGRHVPVVVVIDHCTIQGIRSGYWKVGFWNKKNWDDSLAQNSSKGSAKQHCPRRMRSDSRKLYANHGPRNKNRARVGGGSSQVDSRTGEKRGVAAEPQCRGDSRNRCPSPHPSRQGIRRCPQVEHTSDPTVQSESVRWPGRSTECGGTHRRVGI